MKNKKLKIALGILSGRLIDLSDEQLEILGYDIYKLREGYSLSKDDLKEKSEEIILDRFLKEGE